MSTTHVLVYLDFNKTFMVESNASGTGLGAMLTQDGQLL
jgi:hypothetical protein